MKSYRYRGARAWTVAYFAITTAFASLMSLSIIGVLDTEWRALLPATILSGISTTIFAVITLRCRNSMREEG